MLRYLLPLLAAAVIAVAQSPNPARFSVLSAGFVQLDQQVIGIDVLKYRVEHQLPDAVVRPPYRFVLQRLHVPSIGRLEAQPAARVFYGAIGNAPNVRIG